MTVYDIIAKYGKGKGENQMWESVKYISDFIEPMENSHPEEYWKFIKGLYATIAGKHYNEEFAIWQVKQMFFEDQSGKIHKAPYWTTEEVEEMYEANRSKLPANYNFWDFYVAINMIKSDLYCLLMNWFKDSNNDRQITDKLIELTVNYFNDKDAPYPDTKIWCYFNR